jgi:hypothetical protein
VTWLDRGDAFEPQRVVDDLIDEERLDEDPGPQDDRSGDIPSARAAAGELRRAGFAEVRARDGILEYSWTAASYLEFVEQYDAAEIFASLRGRERRRVRERLATRLAALPASAFDWAAPVVFASGRKPGP